MTEQMQDDAAVSVENSAASGKNSTKKTIMIALAVVLGIAALGGAAFLAMRLMNAGLGGGNGPRMGQGGPSLTVRGGPGGAAQQSIQLNVTPAPEIPERTADSDGIITGFKDNSFLLGTDVSMTVSASEGGEIKADPEIKGPTIEVVVTKETKIYKDVTFQVNEPPMPGESAEASYQQVVEEISLSELSEDALVRVWGGRRGDRLVAEVIMYTEPIMIRRGN